jgi:regulator of cell morphogenesis and NO signaling
MFKEEHVLFPYITELVQAQDEESVPPVAPFVTVNNPIRRMMLEHDMAGEILRELRRVTANYKTPSDACISFRTLYDALEALEKDLHQHIHLENNILFPRSAELEALLSHASMDVLA